MLVLELLKGMLKANWPRVIILCLTLICAITIALLEKPSKKDREKDEGTDRRRRKIVISVFAIILALTTLGDGVRLLFTPESLESWVPTQKAGKVYERFPIEESRYDFFDRDYYISLDKHFYLDLEKFRLEYNENASKAIDSFEISYISKEIGYMGKVPAEQRYEYDFEDSSRLSISTTASSSETSVAVNYISLDVPIPTMDLNQESLLEDFQDYQKRFMDGVRRIFDIAEAMNYVEAMSNAVDGGAWKRNSYDTERYAILFAFPFGSPLDHHCYIDNPIEALSERDINDMSNKEYDAYKKYPAKVFCWYITENSIKSFIVPYSTGKPFGLVTVENEKGDKNSPISVSPGDRVKITLPVTFLRNTIDITRYSSPDELILRVSLPENIKYIPNSTRITELHKEKHSPSTLVSELQDEVFETTELPDGITTDAGLSMGIVMPDYGVRYVTFLAQLNPSPKLFAENNAPVITARIHSGNNEIEQSVTLNVG